MPAAISEVGNIVASSVPSDVRHGVPRRPRHRRRRGGARPGRPASVAAAFDGAALDTTTCIDTVHAGIRHGRRDRTAEPAQRACRSTASSSAAATPARRPCRSVDGPSATVVDSDRLNRTIKVEDCPDGCWLIVGEGHHPSWQAATAAGSLGPSAADRRRVQRLVDPAARRSPSRCGSGGRPSRRSTRRSPSAWPPRSSPSSWRSPTGVRVPRRHAPRPSASLGEPAIRRTAPQRRRRHRLDRARRSVRRSVRGPGGGSLGGAAVVATRRIRLAGLVAVAALVRIAVDVVTTVRRDSPSATPGFPLLFEDLHHLGLFAAVALAVSALARRRA